MDKSLVCELKLITGETILCEVYEVTADIIKIGTAIVLMHQIINDRYGVNAAMVPRLYSGHSEMGRLIMISTAMVVTLIPSTFHSSTYLREMHRYLIINDAKRKLESFDYMSKQLDYETFDLHGLSETMH